MEMMKRLEAYEKSMITPNIGPEIENGNPRHFNGTFSPGWCQSEPNVYDIWSNVEIDILE